MEAPAPNPSLPHNLVLVGFMGSGKSSLGRTAARELGFRFLDTDQMIVEQCGRPISEIFATDGEAVFRAMETDVIRSLEGVRNCVVSTGGGAILAAENRSLLRALGFVVWLTASEETLFERVSRNSKRPLLQTANPRATLERLLRERDGLYRESAHWVLDTSHLTQPAAARALLEQAKEAFACTGSR